VIDETRQRGRLITTKQVRYIAESVSYSHIDAADFANLPAATAETVSQAEPRRSGTAYTPLGDTPCGPGLVDSLRHFAYFSTVHEPGRILKVDLNARSGSGPAIVGALVLEPEEDRPFYSAIDEKGGYAYFGTDFPGKIVKVALGNGAEPPSRIGSVLLDQQYNVRAGVVDSTAGYGCFSIANRLCKVKLGNGDEPPLVASWLAITNDPLPLDFVSAVLDPTAHTAYFGSDSREVFKIDLGTNDSPPRIIGVLTCPEDEQGLRGALIDPQNGCAWFASDSGYIIKIALGAPGEPPTRVGSLKLPQPERYLQYTFGMDHDGYGYFGVMSEEMILKVALGGKNALPRLVAAVPVPASPNLVPSFQAGVVDPTTRTMCLGVGSINCVLMTLTLGDGDSPPSRIGETKLYAR
jgi:hypothetical protein